MEQIGETQSRNKKTYSYLSYAKVIGIFFIVLGHGCVTQDMKQWIFSFHVPLFFFISGLLWYPQSALSNLKKSLKTIVLPYFTISIIRLIIDLFLLLYEHSLTAEAVFARLGAIALGLGYTKSNFIPVCMPLWFLYALFIVRFLVSLCKNRLHYVVLLVFALGICFTLRYFGIDLLFPADSALLSLPFFVCGFWLKKRILSEDLSVWKSIISVVFILLLIPLTWYNGYVDINLMCTGRSVLLFYGIALTYSICIINICKLFNRGGGGGTFCPQYQMAQ